MGRAKTGEQRASRPVEPIELRSAGRAGGLAACLTALLAAFGPPVSAQESVDPEIDAVVQGWVDAFNDADSQRASAHLAEEARMFFPFPDRANRVQGKEAIEQVLESIFTRLRSAADGPPYLSLEPVDVDVQKLAPDVAVATWHFSRPTQTARRTAVLVRSDAGWRIASFHASNVAQP